jgi:hypothetical protein
VTYSLFSSVFVVEDVETSSQPRVYPRHPMGRAGQVGMIRFVPGMAGMLGLARVVRSARLRRFTSMTVAPNLLRVNENASTVFFNHNGTPLATPMLHFICLVIFRNALRFHLIVENPYTRDIGVANLLFVPAGIPLFGSAGDKDLVHAIGVTRRIRATISSFRTALQKPRVSKADLRLVANQAFECFSSKDETVEATIGALTAGMSTMRGELGGLVGGGLDTVPEGYIFSRFIVRCALDRDLGDDALAASRALD